MRPIIVKKSPSAPLLRLLSLGSGGGGEGGAASPPHSASFSNNTTNSFPPPIHAMRRSASTVLLFLFFFVFLFSSFSLYSFRNPIYVSQLLYPSIVNQHSSNRAIQEHQSPPARRFSSLQDSNLINSVSVLVPDWQVLVIVPPDTELHVLSSQNFTCLYPNHAAAPARFSGFLPSTRQTTFRCSLPRSARSRYPYLAPILTNSPEKALAVPWPSSPPQELISWRNIVYESFSTENDVVLFAKGINNRQGINRSPREFNCVFFVEANNNTVIKTAVTSSVQEVFRCHHPDLTAFGYKDSIKLKVSLEIPEENKMVASVAYYIPWSKIKKPEPKSQLCATAMVYNVGKFLKEWVMYHSQIGVEKVILYDNDSDDDLKTVVKDLNEQGYSVSTLLWVWPKTQEAGFSHAALYAKDSCNWMMYVDVDEFVFVPSWENSLEPSDQMLKSLLSHGEMIGEVSIKCNEFGPSNQRSHPAEGVTQGYNCRRKVENRHKSIVLLEAVDNSLLNVIHHFSIKEEYIWKQMSIEAAVVNHYKYQAWSEFKAKFRRRVSAYVVDWMTGMNPLSKDRTPGLGYEAVEPSGWESKFCEVRDDRLKMLTQRWFGTETETGSYRMAWQN